MKKEELLKAGKVNSHHGVKGQVKIYSYLDNPKDLKNYQLYNKDLEPIDFEFGFVKRMQVIARIGKSQTIEESEKLINNYLYINKDDLPDTDEGEFYYSDLIGIKMLKHDDKKVVLGSILAVHNFGAGDIVEYKNHQGRKEMTSFNDQIFLEIDLEDKEALVKLPEIDLDNSKDSDNTE